MSTVVVVIAMITMTVCSNKNSLSETVNANPELEHSKTSPAPVASSAGTGGSSEFQFIITESSIEVDEDGETVASIGNEYTVEGNLSQITSQYPQVNLAAIGQNSSQKANTIEEQNSSARHLPTSVSYGGGNTIEYVLDGQQKTGSLNPDLESLISGVQQDFVTAYNTYDNMPAPAGGSNPLLQKTDQEIKQMLESEGYTVTSLGNMQFEITKTIGSVEITETFNAETFSMESQNMSYSGHADYSQNFQGNTYLPVRSIAQ